MTADYKLPKYIQDDEEFQDNTSALYGQECAEEEAKSNRVLTAVTVMALEPMENIVLAAANNGVNFTGKIPPRNLAFEPMRNASLIKDDGTPRDKQSLMAALAYVINQRVDAGTFV